MNKGRGIYVNIYRLYTDLALSVEDIICMDRNLETI